MSRQIQGAEYANLLLEKGTLKGFKEELKTSKERFFKDVDKTDVTFHIVAHGGSGGRFGSSGSKSLLTSEFTKCVSEYASTIIFYTCYAGKLAQDL